MVTYPYVISDVISVRMSENVGRLSPHTPLFSRLAGGGNLRFPPLAPVGPQGTGPTASASLRSHAVRSALAVALFPVDYRANGSPLRS